MSNPKRPLDYNYGLRGLPNGEAHETLNLAEIGRECERRQGQIDELQRLVKAYQRWVERGAVLPCPVELEAE